MENNKTTLSSEESLSIIAAMIESSKKELRDNGSWYLLWGWLVFFAAAINYVLILIDYSQPSIAWLLMPLGGVISVFKGRKEDKLQKVRTYVDSFMKYVLIAFLVCLLMVLFNQGTLKIATYPMVMMVYGMWLFISGGALAFRPLQIGGWINWIFAVIAFYVTFDIQLILLAMAVLLGYIIPGYMLRSRYNKAAKSGITTLA